jgi:DNA sulfur modification protein DndB
MGSQFEAARGHQGDLEYFVTTMRFGELAKNVGYAERDLGEGAEMPAELARQRKLNIKRVRDEMRPYLIQNPDHFFSAIAVEVVRPGDTTHDIKFTPSSENSDFGRISFDGTELLAAVDGQHRLKAIQLAIQEMPELARESIAVVFLPHRSIERSQQLFSDLNRYAKTPSKTLSLLFEHREFAAQVAKQWARQCRAFKDGRTNMETNSLVVKSRHLITLSVLYECARELMAKDYDKKKWDRAELDSEAERVGRQLSEWYDEVVIPALPDIEAAITGSMKPVKLREQYVYPHSVGWRAIARAVRAAMDQRPHNWKDQVTKGLAAIDWSITNRTDWEGSALVAGAMANRRQNTVRAGTVVMLKLGLEPTESEQQELLTALKAINSNAELPSPALGRLRATA